MPHQSNDQNHPNYWITWSTILATSSRSPTNRCRRSNVSVGGQIVNFLADLQCQFGLTLLFSAHSMAVVRSLTDIAVMRRGEIVEIGTSEQITSLPAREYTRSLLQATPEPD